MRPSDAPVLRDRGNFRVRLSARFLRPVVQDKLFTRSRRPRGRARNLFQIPPAAWWRGETQVTV